MATQLYPRRLLRKSYTPAQRAVLFAIGDEAIRRYGSAGSAGGRRIVRPERRKIKSAYLTGRVESNFENNPNMLDHDSLGWRQERKSLYPNPLNLKASVRRYFNEADQLYQGDTAASLSGRVQRPASQYLYRYGQQSAEGSRLLAALRKQHAANRRGGAAKGGGHGGGGASAKASGTPASLRELIGGGTQATPVAGSAPPDPEFSGRANLKLPEMAGDVPASDVPSFSGGAKTDLGELRRMLSSSPVQSPVPSPVSFGGTLGGRVPAGGITFKTGRGRPVPLNPARFQVGKSGRTAVLRRGPHEGEVVAWQGGRWRFARGGRPVKGLKWRPQGGQHALSNATFPAPKGQVLGSPIDRPGVSTKPILKRFTRRLAGQIGKPVTFGTGTAHDQYTTTGGQSEHWTGDAIDLPASGKRLWRYGVGALRLVGVKKPAAKRMASQGGIYNITYKGHRFQIIVRTMQGGNHFTHLHVGVS